MSTPRKAPPGSKPTYDALEKRCRELQRQVNDRNEDLRKASRMAGLYKLKLERAETSVLTMSELLFKAEAKVTASAVFDDEIPF